MGNEKRASDRVTFPFDKKIEATLLPVDGDKGGIIARVLNISEGGIGLSFEKSEQLALEQNRELLIDQIAGDDTLLCLQGQKMKIVWVLNSDIFASLGVGCEFISISDNCVECIRALGTTETEASQDDAMGR